MAKKDKKTQEHWLKELVRTIVFALLLAVGVRTILYEPFHIPSPSMYPSLLIGDYLFISKFTYGYSRFSLPFNPPIFSGRVFGSPPKSGDVIVFCPPHDLSEYWIKRVIGVPGDRVQMIEGILHVNGEPATLEKKDIYTWTDQYGNGHMSTEYIETLPNGVQHSILKTDPFVEAKRDDTPEYIVPPEYMFMMGDNRDRSSDSRFPNVLGFVPIENIVGRADILFFSTEIPTDPNSAWWMVWKWPFVTRFSRFFHLIS